ncbi:MAG: lysylphosphatidylglycerol synthase domain-containing protein [Anaerolineales bacterium]
MLTKHRRTIYRVGLALGMGLFLYQAYAGYQGFSQLKTSPAQFNTLVITVVIAICAFVLPTMTWGVLMHSEGTSLPWIEILRGYPLSFIPRYIPGSIWGYLSRSEWLSAAAKMPYVKSMMISFLEIWVVLVSGTTVILLHLVPIARTANFLLQGTITFAIILASWILLRLVTQIPMIRTRIMRISSVDHLPKPGFGLYLLAVVLYGIMWFLYGLVLSGVIAIMGSQKFSYLPGTSAYFAISWMAGFLVIIIPSGLGVRELALVSLLSTFPNINVAQIGATAVLMRFLVILGEFFWVGISQVLVYLISRGCETSDAKSLGLHSPD